MEPTSTWFAATLQNAWCYIKQNEDKTVEETDASISPSGPFPGVLAAKKSLHTSGKTDPNAGDDTPASLISKTGEEGEDGGLPLSSSFQGGDRERAASDEVSEGEGEGEGESSHGIVSSDPTANAVVEIEAAGLNSSGAASTVYGQKEKTDTEGDGGDRGSRNSNFEAFMRSLQSLGWGNDARAAAECAAESDYRVKKRLVWVFICVSLLIVFGILSRVLMITYTNQQRLDFVYEILMKEFPHHFDDTLPVGPPSPSSGFEPGVPESLLEALEEVEGGKGGSPSDQKQQQQQRAKEEEQKKQRTQPTAAKRAKPRRPQYLLIRVFNFLEKHFGRSRHRYSAPPPTPPIKIVLRLLFQGVAIVLSLIAIVLRYAVIPLISTIVHNLLRFVLSFLVLGGLLYWLFSRVLLVSWEDPEEDGEEGGEVEGEGERQKEAKDEGEGEGAPPLPAVRLLSRRPSKGARDDLDLSLSFAGETDRERERERGGGDREAVPSPSRRRERGTPKGAQGGGIRRQRSGLGRSMGAGGSEGVDRQTGGDAQQKPKRKPPRKSGGWSISFRRGQQRGGATAGGGAGEGEKGTKGQAKETDEVPALHIPSPAASASAMLILSMIASPLTSFVSRAAFGSGSSLFLGSGKGEKGVTKAPRKESGDIGRKGAASSSSATGSTGRPPIGASSASSSVNAEGGGVSALGRGRQTDGDELPVSLPARSVSRSRGGARAVVSRSPQLPSRVTVLRRRTSASSHSDGRGAVRTGTGPPPLLGAAAVGSSVRPSPESPAPSPAASPLHDTTQRPSGVHSLSFAGGTSGFLSKQEEKDEPPVVSDAPAKTENSTLPSFPSLGLRPHRHVSKDKEEATDSRDREMLHEKEEEEQKQEKPSDTASIAATLSSAVVSALPPLPTGVFPESSASASSSVSVSAATGAKARPLTGRRLLGQSAGIRAVLHANPPSVPAHSSSAQPEIPREEIFPNGNGVTEKKEKGASPKSPPPLLSSSLGASSATGLPKGRAREERGGVRTRAAAALRKQKESEKEKEKGRDTPPSETTHNTSTSMPTVGLQALLARNARAGAMLSDAGRAGGLLERERREREERRRVEMERSEGEGDEDEDGGI
uniref:Transmembrane protein n=1 Tax=Chromera velia CCMP2878 TaxID=1169474 RepID=A0A0G4GJZ6_9ALVE|eukprot:Cvel_22225.t1-p1 / transcript=Cvel_22225.t1 / gene=Cvel_22225 / organism=Chromera_velia_CCMP2878 / gene_product=hypothetical protein / transcript_product=hypothetical protein / location=Cvel_scaffold2162:14674-19257(+) / protein_length=1106 / sequence_SO=supercontig / SO=protein_coding / is_pseudo=false